MKTANTVTPTGIKAYETEPIFTGNILEYNGIYYRIGEGHKKFILLTVRPLNENGTWQYKTETEYLCIKNGEEKGFTATEFKVVSRGSGRSAVAASAYMSCSRMYNDYDGIQHDYTRKQGLIYQKVMLPPMAPSKWIDREQLYTAS